MTTEMKKNIVLVASIYAILSKVYDNLSTGFVTLNKRHKREICTVLAGLKQLCQKTLPKIAKRKNRLTKVEYAAAYNWAERCSGLLDQLSEFDAAVNSGGLTIGFAKKEIAKIHKAIYNCEKFTDFLDDLYIETFI